MTSRTVHVVVVAYHSPEQLESCLATLRSCTRVTVVDNSSSTEVHAVARGNGAEYVDPGRNLGFAGGVNVALRTILVGEPCDVLLLNPDAVLTPVELEHLVDDLHQERNLSVAALSPRLIDDSGKEQRVLWPFPTPTRLWAEAVGLGRLRAAGDFAVGAVLLLRWEALREVGLFDERFFLYAEEADWQRRASRLGWTSRLNPDVAARHIGGGASDDPIRRETLFHAAQETYIRKWHGRLGWFVYRAAAVVGAAARSVVLTGDRRAEALRRVALYVNGPRRAASTAKR